MFLSDGEVYFKERFFLPAVKKNISRKQISHPSERNAPIQGQLSLRQLCLRACYIVPWESILTQGLSRLPWDQLVLILSSI